jgi:ankyrin repeat protein
MVNAAWDLQRQEMNPFDSFRIQFWKAYLNHRCAEQLREDLATDPWYVSPKKADDSYLMLAVESRDPGAVKELISLGESPSLPASDGFSFLHQAVDEVSDAGDGPDRDRALAVLTILLEAGADPNVQGVDGMPLHRAAGADAVDAARILLSFGADLEGKMLIDGELTPLMHAVGMGKLLMVRFLLDSGADRRAISGKSLVDPPMTILEIAMRMNVSLRDKILKMLE